MKLPLLTLTALTLASALTSGCVRTFQASVLHPAAATLRGTIRVGEVTADDPLTADIIRRQLEAVLRSGRSRELVASTTGAMTINVDVLTDSTHDSTGLYHPPLQRGWTTVRTAVAASRIRFRITRSNGATIESVVFGDSDREQNISASDLLEQVHTRLIRFFAREIEPWREWQNVAFAVCAWDGRCAQAFSYIQYSQFAHADEILSSMIEDLQSRPAGWMEHRRLAAAFYNRGMVRALQRHFADATSDLRAAIALQPNEQRWTAALRHVSSQARESGALDAQLGQQATR